LKKRKTGSDELALSPKRAQNVSPVEERKLSVSKIPFAESNEQSYETVIVEPPPKLQVKRLSDKAKLPTRGSPFAAGYDLYSAEQKLIPAHGKALVDLQISVAVPAGTYGRVAPRSGLASKFMIDTGAGVIDADYRGTVFVLLFNLSDKDFQVEEGDRVAQLILERIYTPEVVEVTNLDDTVRGTGGFGSTGGHILL
jgi:dUTP pyrophosphatase